MYKADASNPYSSTTAMVGMVPNAIAQGASGTFRTGGQIPGLSVSSGTDYYVGTAGAITATAPIFARLLGTADSTSSLILAPNPRIPAPLWNHICQGRLTLTTATPITTGDVTGATSIFFTPYAGANIALFDGTRWSLCTFTELTLALGTLTSGSPYDVFIFNNAGTLTLESLAWTNATTRATALVKQDGVLMKTGALTRRYLGTFVTTSTTQTEDSVANRYLFNYYNRVIRNLKAVDTTNSWTYTTATWRSTNASTTVGVARVEVCIGWSEDLLVARSFAVAQGNAGGQQIGSGVGIDATSTNSAETFGYFVGTGIFGTGIATYRGYPGVGYHFIQNLEIGDGTNSGTIYGDNGTVRMQTGLMVDIMA